MERVGRLFFGLALPDDAVAALASRLDGLAIPGGVVPPSNWHITLRFMGDTDQVSMERIMGNVSEGDLGAQFRIQLGDLGAFSRPQRADVIWIGLAVGEEQVLDLGVAIEQAAQRAGFPTEDRPLHPHLTLSRLRPPQDVRALLARYEPGPIQWRVSEVVLFRSHLGRGGAKYERLEAFPLGD